MEERYQIIEKIGQGGLGAVYRAFDTRMNRDIAIKRISVPPDDHELQKESIRQLVKEAGALASLQHPHIVTIYDVGSDEEGPYVIMELIIGKTLDEIIERAPLTWSDFREFALQTQEALIAAQELDMIHSDIKPPNIMLSWLPSGKFQVKIVDFGLATLTQGQSIEELQESEAIFGSIFFMAPEQFERVPVDARTDMYAMGCVYYQALTGIYPFQGETGYEVMVSHLHHKVIPLQEVRSDIPLWACEWIMWQINRMPADRPATAREALQIFLQNDKTIDPVMSHKKTSSAVALGPRPRRLTPMSKTTNNLNLEEGSSAASDSGAISLDSPTPSQAMKITAPQPLLPPDGFKPSIHTEVEEKKTQSIVPEKMPGFNAATANIATQTYAIHHEKKPMGIGAKIGIISAITTSLIIGGIVIAGQMKSNKTERRQQAIVAEGKSGTGPVNMSGAELTNLLKEAETAADQKLQNIIAVMARAKSNDNSDFDVKITDFITTNTQIFPEIRTQMIKDVLAKRSHPGSSTKIIEFGRSSGQRDAAIAALESVISTAGDSELPTLLALMEYAPDLNLRKTAESVALEIYKRSSNHAKLSADMKAQLAKAANSKFGEALQRLLAARP